MRLESPWALAALVLLPILIGVYVARERRRERFASRWASPSLLPNLVDRGPGRLRHLPLAVVLVALAALIVGVARPHATVSVPREEATVLIAIDVSRSMCATDVRPTRLAAAQLAAYAFVRKVPEKYRIGVIGFGSNATVAIAPTTDRELVREAIGSLKTGEGTALGDAVLLAATLGRRLRTSDGAVPPMSVLLISDGAREGGRTAPRPAAQRARRLNVPVYTVVLGTANGVVQNTLTGGYREIIRVPPNPSTLRMVARITRGRFFSSLQDEGLSAVYEELRSRLGHRKESREVTDVFAGGSALLLLVGGALSAFWFRRVA